MTHREAMALGYRIDIYREHVYREAGWSFTVALAGRVVIEGWTPGYGPVAKTRAMADALKGIAAREILNSFVGVGGEAA